MDDKKNKKKYIIPEAEIVEFVGNDIITMSSDDDGFADWSFGEELV